MSFRSGRRRHLIETDPDFGPLPAERIEKGMTAMQCRYCGNPLSESDRSCSRCGQSVVAETRQAAGLPAQQPTPAAGSRGNPSDRSVPKRRRKPGCLVLVVLLLAILAVLAYVAAAALLAGPKDLDVRATQADLDSVLKKSGVSVDFLGMDRQQLADFIRANGRANQMIGEYAWTFSAYQEKSFELTPAEATAFINDLFPVFTWFEKAQVRVLASGKAAGSFRVHFDRIGQELIPDVIGQIPPALAVLLPDRFNLYVEGKPFVITENEITLPEQLSVLKVGPVSLRPFIGDTDAGFRTMIMDYVERIYKQIPQLRIHSLKVNARGNFEFSGLIPTRVVIRKK